MKNVFMKVLIVELYLSPIHVYNGSCTENWSMIPCLSSTSSLAVRTSLNPSFYSSTSHSSIAVIEWMKSLLVILNGNWLIPIFHFLCITAISSFSSILVLFSPTQSWRGPWIEKSLIIKLSSPWISLPSRTVTSQFLTYSTNLEFKGFS